jgi:DNA-binding NarL/FixJ family response regulator
VRVVYVEDDDFTRMTTAALLRDLGHEVLAALPGSVGLMDALDSASVDVAVLDLDLGGGPTGLDLAVAVRRRSPKTGVLVLSTYADPALLGVDGPLPPRTLYAVKRTLRSPEQLNEAIELTGDPIRLDESGLPQWWNQGAELPRLRASQIELLRDVAEGWTNAEIAARRSVREEAVEKSVQRLARALGVDTQASGNPRVLMTLAYVQMAGGAPGGDRG